VDLFIGTQVESQWLLLQANAQVAALGEFVGGVFQCLFQAAVLDLQAEGGQHRAADGSHY
jgi:hypothetical protein